MIFIKILIFLTAFPVLNSGVSAVNEQATTVSGRANSFKSITLLITIYVSAASCGCQLSRFPFGQIAQLFLCLTTFTTR